MMKIAAVSLGLVVACAGCGEGLAVDENALGLGDVTVTAPASIRWEDANLWGGEGIHATITNVDDKPYYAALGDAMLIADEQTLLHVAEGGDAFVERRDGDAWIGLERVILIEGLRTIILNPGESYSLLGYVRGQKHTGTYRIRVAYYTTSDRSVKAGDALSNAFEVR